MQAGKLDQAGLGMPQAPGGLFCASKERKCRKPAGNQKKPNIPGKEVFGLGDWLMEHLSRGSLSPFGTAPEAAGRKDGNGLFCGGARRF
jgi:hypothetical protein